MVEQFAPYARSVMNAVHAAPGALAAQGKKLKVFIVEDSVTVQAALREMLEGSLDARIVGIASSEEGALQWAGEHPGAWDVAIVDLMLDQGAGFNVIRRLKDHARDAQVVVFSGYVTDVIRHHCRLQGADAVFDKRQSRELLEYLEGR
jgi:DNA-binding NarL/FixJ family response regulator